MKAKVTKANLAALLGALVLSQTQLPAYCATADGQAPSLVSSGNDASQPAEAKLDKLIAQQDAPVVLSGRVSNVDTLSRDILKDEIKLERFNLNYRMNAAKQGRWKGWRYFAFQEAALGLIDADLISMTAYRGHGIHHPELVHKGPAANGTVLPAFLGFIISGSGDALEFGINAYHSYEAGKNGFSPAQSRKYVAGLVSGIDKKIAEREALIREQPSNDSNVAAMQTLESKVLKDVRDASIEEFGRFNVGARSTMVNQQLYYALDVAEKTTGAVWAGMTMHLILRGKERMCTSSGIVFLVNAGQTVLDPLIAHFGAKAAAKLEEHALAATGLSVPPAAPRLAEDSAQIKQWWKDNQSSSNPEIAALLPRVGVYDNNMSYYSGEARAAHGAKAASARALVDNMGWGTFVGGSKLPFGILPVIAGTKLMRGKVVNTYYFTGAVSLLPAVSLATINATRGQITSELQYQRRKAAHTLFSDIVKERMVALDQLDAKL